MALFLALDSTSISRYSEQLVHIARAKNKDEDDLPQINLLMLVDAADGLPVFYRENDGNVPAVSTLRRVIADNARPELKDVILVSDKGSISNKNIEDCLRSDVSFIFNMKCRVSGSLTQHKINESRNGLRDLNNRDCFTHISCVVKKVLRKYERTPVIGKKAQNRDESTLYWYVYFDEKNS